MVADDPCGHIHWPDACSWVNDNPQAFIATSFRYPTLPFDAEHSTELLGPKGEEAPAYAWIDAMRVNADGSIDGHIEWTPDGEALFAVRSTAITARLSVISLPVRSRICPALA
jgi:hypothetical protein